MYSVLDELKRCSCSWEIVVDLFPYFCCRMSIFFNFFFCFSYSQFFSFLLLFRSFSVICGILRHFFRMGIEWQIYSFEGFITVYYVLVCDSMWLWTSIIAILETNNSFRIKNRFSSWFCIKIWLDFVPLWSRSRKRMCGPCDWFSFKY